MSEQEDENMFDEEAFNKFLIDNNVVGFFETPIILKSGRQSYWYANCRTLSNTFENLDKLADYVISFAKQEDLEFDYVYGVPEGASKLAVVVNYKLGLSNPAQKIIIGRGKPKEHGVAKDKYFIGNVKEGDKVLVLEDVTTTGGSLLSAVKQLREAKVNIVGAVGLVNRMEKDEHGRAVEDVMHQNQVPYYAIGNALRLLPFAREKYQPAAGIVQQVEQEFQKYGVKLLNW